LLRFGRVDDHSAPGDREKCFSVHFTFAVCAGGARRVSTRQFDGIFVRACNDIAMAASRCRIHEMRVFKVFCAKTIIFYEISYGRLYVYA